MNRTVIRRSLLALLTHFWSAISFVARSPPDCTKSSNTAIEALLVAPIERVNDRTVPPLVVIVSQPNAPRLSEPAPDADHPLSLGRSVASHVALSCPAEYPVPARAVQSRAVVHPGTDGGSVVQPPSRSSPSEPPAVLVVGALLCVRYTLPPTEHAQGSVTCSSTVAAL